MFELNNRELATVIIITTICAVMLLVPKIRRKTSPKIIEILKNMFVWKNQTVLFSYITYATTLIYLAYKLNLWDLTQLKDTIIILLFVGIPLCFTAMGIKSGKNLLKDVTRNTVGFSAITIFYVDSVSLSLLGELILIPIATLVTMYAIVTKEKPEYLAMLKVANGVLMLIGFFLIFYTTKTILSSWDENAWSDVTKNFVFLLWFSFAMIPFIYTLAFIVNVESALIMLPYHNNHKKPLIKVRIAFVLGLRFKIRLGLEFKGRWLGKIAKSDKFSDAQVVMKKFRAAVKQRNKNLKAYKKNQNMLSGVVGVDEKGFQIDRREFHATKETLTSLYYKQMGWYRNREKEYRLDLLDFLTDAEKKGLPQIHSIQIVVRKDKQAWYAWRQTVNGYYFGVGGNKEIDAEWQYDAEKPPTGFPSTKSPEWVNTTVKEFSPEWANNDAPPNLV